MTKYAKLKDPGYENEMRQCGYVVIPGFIDEADVESLLWIYRRYYTASNGDSRFWHSAYDLDKTHSIELNQFISKILLPKIDAYFEDWAAPIFTLIDKNSNNNSYCEIHRDCSVFDESKFGYRNIWIPLIDINETNGALFVLPGSHVYFDQIFPIGLTWPYRELDDIITKYVKTLYPHRGDMILYDQSMIHGSWINKSKLPRPVVHTGVVSREHEYVFYKVERTEPNIEVVAYKVEDDFYLNGENSKTLNDNDIVFRKDIVYKKYTPEEFEIVISKDLHSS